jgi:DNA-binding transcriptional regulator YdaS (Cro superfamily)
MSEYTKKEMVIIAGEMDKLLRYVIDKSFLARKLGVTPQLVGQWWARGWIPLKHIKTISDLTGGKVKCHLLAPGKFPEVKQQA